MYDQVYFNCVLIQVSIGYSTPITSTTVSTKSQSTPTVDKCANCNGDSDACLSIRLSSNNEFCQVTDPCSCECCGLGFQCNSFTLGGIVAIAFCEKFNGIPGA